MQLTLANVKNAFRNLNVHYCTTVHTEYLYNIYNLYLNRFLSEKIGLIYYFLFLQPVFFIWKGFQQSEMYFE
jgi:hypothetical protein